MANNTYSQIDANKRRTWLLIAIFGAFLITIAWFFDVYMGYSYIIVVIAIILSIVMGITSYYKGDAVALRSTHAVKIKKEDNPYVYRMVENLAITAGVPTPKVYVIKTDALNAFATGRDPKHASIAVTSGIVKTLTNEELEGVIAHEMSHVRNYDIRVMTLVVILVGTIALISNWFIQLEFFGIGGRRRSNNSGDGQLGLILMIVGLVLIILSPIIAKLIQLSISRKREYLADASGALLTRYPKGLADALEKIGQSTTALPHVNSATAHLFISNPFKGKKINAWTSTHPPIAERIKRLKEMDGQANA